MTTDRELLEQALDELINRLRSLAGEPYRFDGHNEIGVAMLEAADFLSAVLASADHQEALQKERESFKAFLREMRSKLIANGSMPHHLDWALNEWMRRTEATQSGEQEA